MKYAQIIGMKIKDVRLMTVKEQKAQYWDYPATVIVLENGITLYPSRDDEGNGAGVLFGTYKGKHFGF